MKHLRFLVSVLLALSGLGLSFNGTAQEGALTPAALDQILEETNAAGTIANLAQVLIGPEEFDEKMIEYGVLLKIAQEAAFPELDLQGWFKTNLGKELKQTDLARFDLVRRALKTHPDLYKQLEEKLAQLAPSSPETGTETETGATSPSGSTTAATTVPGLAQLASQFKELSDRLAALEERVSQMSSSLGGLRGLVLFLLVLVILMLIWVIYLRVRELSRTFR